METTAEGLAASLVADGPAETDGPLTPLNLITGILIRPRATFERLQEAPRNYWWLVFLIAILSAILVAAVTTSVTQRQFAAISETFTVPEGVELPDDFEMPTQSTGSTALSLGLTVGGRVGRMLIGYLISSLMIFAMGLVLGGKVSFKGIFPVAVWATLPLALRGVVQSVAMLVTGSTVISGLGGVLSNMESASMPLLYLFLTQIDVYLIWSLVLLGIGTAVTARLSRGKAAIAVLSVVLISASLLALGQVASSAASEMLGTNISLPGVTGSGPGGGIGGARPGGGPGGGRPGG